MRKHNDIVCRTMDYEDCVCETIYHADRIKALDLFDWISMFCWSVPIRSGPGRMFACERW